MSALLPANFQRQYRVGRKRLDFADPAAKVAIEVNGCWYHTCPACHPGGPEYPTQRHAKRKDEEKAALLRDMGWRLVVLWEHEQYFFKEELILQGIIP